MNCEQAQSLLMELSDSSIDLDALMGAASHVLQCEPCARLAREIAEIQRTLRTPDDASLGLSPATYDALADRMLPTPAVARPSRLRWVTAAAACLAVAGSGFWIGTRQNHLPQPIVADTHLDELMTLTPVDLRRSRQTFDQVTAAFDGRAAWVMTSDRTADVGLGRDESDPGGPLLLIRLALRSSGKLVSSADLTIVSGREARITLPTETGRQVRYQINTDASKPGMLSVRAELMSDDGGSIPLATLGTHIQVTPGEPVRAGEVVTSTGEYEVMVGFAPAPVTGGAL